MSDIILDFIYNENLIKIQCQRNEYMKDIFKRYLIKINKDKDDIYFMCNGNKINEELKLEEINNKDNEIKILVNNINEKKIENEEEVLKKYKDIICPECGEICLFNIKDYKIILNKCIHNHCIENILLDEYNDCQKNNELNILCSNCNKNKKEIYNNQFYKCCNCKINLCPICKVNHNKEHILIDYELKNYFCNIHGKNYISYCKKCNMNLCLLCEIDHTNHNYNSLTKLITNKKK